MRDTFERRLTAVIAALTALAAAAAAGPLGGQQRISPTAVERLEAAVDSLVRAVMDEQRVPGVALVIVGDGRVLVRRGWGVRDVERNLPVDPDSTIFRIGSATKALTGLALLQLVAGGEVDLDAPVARYLDLPALEPRFGEPVRVRHLLEHTGGFDQRGVARQAPGPAGRPSLRSFLEGELVAVRPPGVAPVYDTYGITLAGHLVEAVSGVPYARYMRERLFEPLGMERSRVEARLHAPELARDHLAVGYGLDDGALVAQEYEWYVTLPASSVDATASDMGRLLLALLGTDEWVLPPEPQRVYPGGLEAFSWGWWEDERRNLRVLHHGGIMAGYSSELLFAPEAGIGLFVAYNRDGETGPEPGLRDAVVETVFAHLVPEGRGDLPPDRPIEGPPPADLEPYAGPYANTLGCFTCEEGEGWALGTLALEADGSEALELPGQRWLPRSPEVFELEGSGRRIAFLEGPLGERYLVSGTTSWVRLDDALFAAVLGPDWRTGPPSPLVAVAHRAAGRWGDAADVYRRLVDASPGNGRYAFNGAFAALNAGRLDEADAGFRRAEELGRWVPWSVYYRGAVAAARGDGAGALRLLERALDLGFADARLLDTEPWWDDLRDDPDFVELRGELGG